jgi:hypothetical protein
MAVPLALLAALLSAAAWVLQYHEAHEAPKRLFLSPRLLLELAHHRIWVAGLVAMVLGGLVQAAALGSGSLAVVEPLLATSLVFALWLSAMWQRQRLSVSELAAALMVSGGLAVLLVVGSPTRGKSTMSTLAWALTTSSAWAIATLLVVVGRRREGPPQAALIAGAAGVLFGLQDALTRFCLDHVDHGVLTLATRWQPYVLVVTAIYGLTLIQSSYEAGSLEAALPSLAIGEPVAGMLIGLVAFDEHLRTSGLAPLIEAGAAAVMIVGCVLLSRSPLVLGRHHARRRGGRPFALTPADAQPPRETADTR